jgi:hypothetical protein
VLEEATVCDDVVDESMTELKGASCDEGVVETLTAVLEGAAAFDDEVDTHGAMLGAAVLLRLCCAFVL